MGNETGETVNRLHRGSPANRARRAARCERVALDKAAVHLRAGRPESALALLVIVAPIIDGLRGQVQS